MEYSDKLTFEEAHDVFVNHTNIATIVKISEDRWDVFHEASEGNAGYFLFNEGEYGSRLTGEFSSLEESKKHVKKTFDESIKSWGDMLRLLGYELVEKNRRELFKIEQAHMPENINLVREVSDGVFGIFLKEPLLSFLVPEDGDLFMIQYMNFDSFNEAKTFVENYAYKRISENLREPFEKLGFEITPIIERT